MSSTSAEEQGFFRKIGNKLCVYQNIIIHIFSCYVGVLCRAAYDNQNPRAAAELLGLTDETEVQKFTMPHACSLVTNFNLHIEIFVQGGEAGLRL